MIVASLPVATALLANAAAAYYVEDGKIIYRKHDPVLSMAR
jgi:hypothetical protein